MTPANQTRQSILAASKVGARLFRANTGLAWAGSKLRKILKAETIIVPAGALIIYDPRPFKAGVEGMSDSTGWISVIVTPEMVGQRIAVYCAVEDKSGSGRPTKEQAAFIGAVNASGGRAGVARSEQDVVEILTGVGRLFPRAG